MASSTQRIFKPLSPEAAANMDIGVFGQQAGMQIYTQITYVFEAKEDRKTTIATLEAGLARLVKAFPWLGGQILTTNGRRHFAPLPNGPAPLVVKDAPLSLDELRSAGYPFRLLDESVVSPRRTLPSPEEPEDKPVLLVQATFIEGGFLLTVVAHHAAMDMAGQAAVIRWLAKGCRGESYSENDLAIGNCDRLQFIDLLGDDEGGQDPFALIPEQVIQPPPAAPAASATSPPSPPPSSWSYFAFDRTALAALKKGATATLPATAKTSFVSTNDALTAFLWQSIVRARRGRLEASASPPAPSTLARAIDIRRFFGISPEAPSLLQNMTIHTEPVARVAEAPLGELASDLRTAILDEDRLRERTRALATAFIRFPEKSLSSVSFVGSVDTAGGGLMLSSWTLAPDFRQDFGVGHPVAVRRPQFTPVESLAYLMPADADGTVVAGLCLREADRTWLEKDGLFSKHGRYVG
ncbi:hypothetical protein SEUCBS139899_001874 [Sporothrix eucalyptigena]|uniref:Trichothecene 3-O-acetyltransferase-like N-terminal domain-containing protein n=1 Tax=Sporothrix eucalyptigena TaxID=1812306 RepID=A0ABP0BZ46_9PEZI